MKLYAGVDGGQSSTIVALGDGERELARAVGPPADLVGLSRDADRQVEVVRATVAAAVREARLAPDVRLTAVVAGISGFDRGESREPDLAAIAEHATTLHDAEIAHAGALAGHAGIVVIAGTGSVALGRRGEGEAFVRAGGWGYFFGDEGSAIWIARAALRRAMASEDRAESSALGAAARAFFGATTLRSIQHAFAHGEIGRPALAAFASDVIALATDGDADSAAVCGAAYDALADLVATVSGRLRIGATSEPRDSLHVSYAGGLFASQALAEGFRAAVAARVPNVVVRPPAFDPAGGALVLARRLA